MHGGDASAVAELQQVQLLRLQDAAKLQQLSLATGPVCIWPMHLVGAWPGPLQKVDMSLYVLDEDDEDLRLLEAAVDLSAFSRAAGCTAELNIFIFAWGSPDVVDSFVAGILAGLHAVGSFNLLRLEWSLEGVAGHMSELRQLQCSRCVIASQFEGHVSQLPPFGHLTVLVEEWDYEADPLSCEWAALASPGVRCLGSADLPLFGLEVRGFSGLPAHRQPWALVIWAHMGLVRGLPVSCFVEQAPGMHVWRNAPGADLDLP